MKVVITKSDLECYAQVDYIIKHMNKRYYEKIPKKLAVFFETYKAPNFPVKVNPHVPLQKQGLKKETLEIIALLHLKYWCENEDRRKQLYNMMENRQKELAAELEMKANSVKLNVEEDTDDGITTASTAPKKVVTVNPNEVRKTFEETSQESRQNGQEILADGESSNIIVNFFKKLLCKLKTVYKNKDEN